MGKSVACYCRSGFHRTLLAYGRASSAGPQWLHEIKHHGYRLLVRKSSGTVRIYTRRGADWTKRFPAIVAAASNMKAASFYLDGEGVVCDAHGIAAFDKLHSKANDHAVFLYAFNLLEIGGGT